MSGVVLVRDKPFILSQSLSLTSLAVSFSEKKNTNSKIDNGEFSLDGIGLITLDVEKMYNTMTEDLALGGTKAYFERRDQQVNGGLDSDEIKVTPQSILEGL